jgi:hypothetical protein
MKANRGMDVEIHIFLTSALAGGEWSASRPCHFTPGKDPPVPIGWEVVWTQRRSERRGEEEILDPTGTRTPTPPSSSP